jgi:hypothetical protein
MSQRQLSSLTLSLVALFVLVLSPPLARADGGDTDHQATVDGYTAELVFPEGSLETGPNTILIRLSNAEGQPVSAAIVQIAPGVLDGADSGEHGHGEGSNGGAATSAPDDTGTASHNDVDAATHAEATSESHDDTRQPGAEAEAHGHSGDAAPSDADTTPDVLMHDEDDQHIETIMTQLDPDAEPGTYTGVVHLDSPGTWQINVQFIDQGRDHALTFAVEVPEPPRDWRLLGAFGGVNALIITTAAVLKRRRPATTLKRTPMPQAPRQEQ